MQDEPRADEILTTVANFLKGPATRESGPHIAFQLLPVVCMYLLPETGPGRGRSRLAASPEPAVERARNEIRA